MERLRKAAEAAATARAQAKEEAEKAAKKGAKKGGGKGKKPAKGAPPPPTPEETAAVASEDAIEPPSVLEVYEEVKREVERHRAFRKEEAARLRAEERLVPRDPTGEAVMQEVSQLVQFESAVVARELMLLSAGLFTGVSAFQPGFPYIYPCTSKFPHQ